MARHDSPLSGQAAATHTVALVVCLLLAGIALAPMRASASELPLGTTQPAPVVSAIGPVALAAGEGGSLESAASKASDTGRKVAMSLIALGLAIAAVVLVFRRDFKRAAGVFAVGLVAVVLATPTGLNVLRDTVSSLFGAS
jgi:lysylphosphatidylglycerol synthetase-like protein (DUF2156 family)